MTGEIKYKFLDPFLLLVDKTEIWERFLLEISKMEEEGSRRVVIASASEEHR